MFFSRTRWIGRGATLVAALAVASTVALRTAPASGAQARPQAKLVPASGALFGAWVDVDGRWVDNQSAEGEVTAFEKQIGRTLDIDAHYYGWTDKFPSGLEQWDLEGKRTPMISWKAGNLDQIAAGSSDGMIRQRAEDLKALGKPVFLRFAWEMNGNWYPWDGTHTSDPGTHNGPDKYVAAWRHLHRVFDSVGADNVIWVWAPNNQSVPSEQWNSAEQYYPGDAYVDWVGVDGYNWGTTQSWSSWTSFTQLFSGFYDRYASNKPIMIAEVGSVSEGGNKADWIRSARAAIKQEFPAIAAFVYFEAPTDWPVVEQPSALDAYRAMASDAYFDGGDNSTSGGGGSGSGSGTSGDGSGDTGAADVQLSGVSASPDTLERWSWIAWAVDKPARVSIRIHDAQGNVIRHRLTRQPFDAGVWGLRWHGKDDDFHRVTGGRYTAVVIAFDAQGRHVRATTEIDVV